MFKWLFKKKGCAKHMNNKLEVIGIDHGWSMMKTISQVFVTGVKEITTTPALFGDVLEYEGKFYKVGTVRQEVKDTKVEDDSFYLLTLAAVAKELKRRGLAEAKVFLAVGLPLTRFGAEKNDFIKYLTKNKRVSFKYENEPYYIEIDDVAIFPQCYAAVVDKIPTMASLSIRMSAIRSQRISGKNSIMRLSLNMRKQRIRATKRRGRVPRNIMAIPIKRRTKRQRPFDNW
ncbi:hypothetical protein K280104A7_28320 [Candidatus Bariatricus faecipullorum]